MARRRKLTASERRQKLDLYSPNELEAMPTLHSGQFHDLKVEDDVDGKRTRWWLSRMTVEDGETHAVYVEQRDLGMGGRWEDVHAYGRPRRYEEAYGNPNHADLKRRVMK